VTSGFAKLRAKQKLGTYRQTNNHAASLADKVELRRLVLEEIGAKNARVFDAFAGAGEMFDRVWHKAAAYVGCDRIFYRDKRTAYVADNRRVLRSVSLVGFNVFDLDSYGAPWEQVLIVARRRPVAPGERIAMVLTEGSGLHLKQGGVPVALRVIAGLDGIPRGVSRKANELLDAACAGLASRMNCRIVKRWEAERKAGASMKYVALIMEGAPR
jgi:hypothetical protein